MAERNIFTVTDLGGGDGGKGGVVHKICVQKKAHTVLKVGGAQGSHGVKTSRGERFNFSHFGCGTFEGVKTHITDRMVIEPYSFLQEGKDLQFEWGIRNIFDYVTIDEDALCALPFHSIASRLRELSRKQDPKGTIGMGIGEAFSDAEIHPETAIYAKDIYSGGLRDKVAAAWEQKKKDLAGIISQIPNFLPEDFPTAKQLANLLHKKGLLDHMVAQFNRLGSLVRIVGKDYLKDKILSKDGTVVVESSHGILTDRYYGFHPHTTKLRTIPAGTYALLRECGYDGDLIRLGVTRAYQIRHGAGPMVSNDPSMVDQLLPGSNKDENRWQGKVRVGPLDMIALTYAIDACGGPELFDGLAITWFDQIKKLQHWDICSSYSGTTGSKFFSEYGEINVRRGTNEAQLRYQEELGNELKKCTPNISTYSLLNLHSDEDLTRMCSIVMESHLNIPVRMVSLGPTEKDKVCF